MSATSKVKVSPPGFENYPPSYFETCVECKKYVVSEFAECEPFCERCGAQFCLSCQELERGMRWVCTCGDESLYEPCPKGKCPEPTPLCSKCANPDERETTEQSPEAPLSDPFEEGALYRLTYLDVSATKRVPVFKRVHAESQETDSSSKKRRR